MGKKQRKGINEQEKGQQRNGKVRVPSRLWASRSPQEKQRQERRHSWGMKRHQVSCRPSRNQGPGWRCAARLQKDQAQATGAPPDEG
ncbi:hypothetical protein HaLaN_13833 [Haematococcus lacustris]|uniref:Uncharacterized protein n=1 Tax=Haematococcus lacustris TaxID=44745 RepID=A0A699Z3Q7_HAELA|nr:hypothetical protein HaLaN_13833 [Haematococcus lacustris]